MPLLLPFFKFNAQDWLLSEKIGEMSGAQVGAYIILLAQAWVSPNCSLLNERESLKNKARWTGSDEEFTRVLACFVPARQSGRIINVRLYREWQEAKARKDILSESGQRGAVKRWARKPATRTKRTTEAVPPTDWLALLKAKPIYAHINWEREMGKIEEWHSRSENKHRIINQKFVANWVNKIEPPLTNGHALTGGPLICPHHPHLTFPDQQAFDTHNFCHHPKYVG